MNDYKAALKKLEGRLNENPDKLELKAQMARVYSLSGDSKRAVETAEDIISIKPGSAYGYRVLATVYESQNRLDDAADVLKKGLQTEEENTETALMLGDLYAKKSDYPLAARTFDGILKKSPGNIQALFALGVLDQQMNKKKDAVKMYREVLAKSETYVPALNNLSYLYSEGYGDRKAALDMAIMAFRISPNNAGVMDTLGYALLNNGRGADALKALKSASTLMPENASVLYHLALAYKDTGNKPLAIENLHAALKNRDFPEAKEASRLLSQLNNGKKN